ncbi:MCP four helix bundle domain-containing protein [Paraburkholderia terrae]|uniref:hypothetical protein n=1 Tax=Paraburkholderia terrae TaxID=311230 RepID=UPI00296B0C1F|nr:hypothetical protein [Paraburkholderia terrae]MDW3661873.1 hypothetical protein [Paraburkholderia terrae]
MATLPTSCVRCNFTSWMFRRARRDSVPADRDAASAKGKATGARLMQQRSTYTAAILQVLDRTATRDSGARDVMVRLRPLQEGYMAVLAFGRVGKLPVWTVCWRIRNY